MANINENYESSQSQCARIKAWLEDGHTITGLEAINKFGCIRLASRINDLRNRGVEIHKEMITLDNGKRVAQYSLKVVK